MKQKTYFVCSNCGARSTKWMGKCNSCNSWDSFIEEKAVSSFSKKNNQSRISDSKIVELGNIDADNDFRIISGINELDRVLGGGIVPGSLVLIGGDPGIGKSTLMLQMTAGLEKFKPLYVTGEESLQQIKLRANRLSNIPDNLSILAETNLEVISNAILSNDFGIFIIDSVQAISSDKVDSAPGSIIQVRECAALLMQIAKQTSKPIFLVGHVTKEGVIAGPKILEHTVDTVLQFEGEKTYSYRILRTLKNRFGSTNEIGIFEMAEFGLREVDNPSELFLANSKLDNSGVAIVAAIEGSRPILLEVQALVSPSGYSVPQRTTNGYDSRRLQMILAVLEKRLGIPFRQYDVFINIAGGVYLSDPSVDLAISAALVSSLKDIPISSGTVLFGEIGLTGEVRQVTAVEQRIKEAEKLGFKEIILPSKSAEKLLSKFSISLHPIERISLALSKLF